jgi:protoheme IX farnesyltransferase
MVVTSLLLWPVAPTGPLYPIVAVILGALFLLEAARLHRRARAGMSEPALGAMRLFHWSITYLALLFAAVAIDALLFA